MSQPLLTESGALFEMHQMISRSERSLKRAIRTKRREIRRARLRAFFFCGDAVIELAYRKSRPEVVRPSNLFRHHCEPIEDP